MIPAEIRLEGVKNSVGLLVKERGEMSGLVSELTLELERHRAESEMMRSKITDNDIIITTTTRKLQVSQDTVSKLTETLKTKEEEILLLKDALLFQTTQVQNLQSQLSSQSDSADHNHNDVISTAVPSTPSPTRPAYSPPVYSSRPLSPIGIAAYDTVARMM
eukprot:TRINITY_DN31838_c0_g1_i1.p1 TRINITY_DN31838_c0_g1~~TRINITY_DN31838_c0_g1_i1.p1  ORF type:complete len:162 (+),score=27.34 TRINITY_DN31838_c0_g1_i1:59-544(+)